MIQLKTPLLPGESVIEAQGCGRAGKAGMSWGGTIFITNQRIIFETNKLNSKLKEITDIIELNEVKEYAYADNLALGNFIAVPGLSKDKSISIRTSKGNYRYSPSKPKKLFEVLKKACTNAVQGEKYSYKESVKESIFGDKNAPVGEKVGAGLRAGTEFFENIGDKITSAISPTKEPAVSAPPGEKDAAAELKKYKEFLDMGAITQEEFEPGIFIQEKIIVQSEEDFK